MKLIDVANLQEPQPSQYALQFTEKVKKIMKAMGWEKGDGIALYRHGAGFFIEKARRSIDEELAAAKKEVETSVPEEKKSTRPGKR